MTTEQGKFFSLFDKDLADFFKDATTLFEVKNDNICHIPPPPLDKLFGDCKHDPEFIQIRKISFIWHWNELNEGVKDADITFLFIKYISTHSSLKYLDGIWVIPYKTMDNAKRVNVCYQFQLEAEDKFSYNAYSEEKYVLFSENSVHVSPINKCIYKILNPNSMTLIKEVISNSGSDFQDCIGDIFDGIPHFNP